MAIYFGYDASGRGNNWTANNLSSTAGAGNDSLTDTPTAYGTDTGVGGEVRGNYCTLNPLDEPATYAAAGSSANGNLDFSVSNDAAMGSTISVSSGKWYWEMTVVSGHSSGSNTVWTAITSITPSSSNKLAWQAGSGSRSYATTGLKYSENTSASYGNTYTNGDVIGCALDLDNGKVYWSKNGTFQASGDPVAGTNAAYTGLTGSWMPEATQNGAVTAWNFGQRAFAYTAPSGFKALCTQNLPTPTIGATSTTQADNYFDIVLRNGFGTSGGSITSVQFQPDFIWEKRRTAANHQLVDSVRGVTKYLSSNLTDAEVTLTTYFTSFNSNGYTLGSGDYGTGDALVDWIWRAGGTAVTNTAGSITSTVSANTTSGFSIVTWTGTGSNATVGHGLGFAPSMIISKVRTTTDNWIVGHNEIPSSPWTKCLFLNTTGGINTNAAYWNNTAPTSSVFTTGTWFYGSQNYVAYCFAPVAGYSAFGSYTGNGSSDGPFVYTGFRPMFILFKQSSASGNDWYIYDAVRSTYNVATNRLFPNSSAAEATNFNTLDILSNGWKVRDSNSAWNASGATYIYACFAASPFKYSLAR